MPSIVLTNANLIDPDEGSRGPATITIVGERVEAVTFGRGAPIRPDAKVYDLKGRSVMPGLHSCHFHSSYSALMMLGTPVGMEAPQPVQALQAAYNVGLALKAGVTSVSSAGAPFAIDACLKIAIEKGLIAGPRIMAGSRDVSTTGHAYDETFPWYWEGVTPPYVVSCDGVDAFTRAVREEIKRGSEIIKVFATSGHGVPGVDDGEVDLTHEEFAAIAKAAHQRKAKVRAHISNLAGIRMALDVGIDLIDHAEGLDDKSMNRIVASGTFVCPSLLYCQRYVERRKGPAADAIRRGMDHMLEMVPKANKAGVKLLLGDDFGSVLIEHGEYGEELDYYVNVVGIPARDVIRWATRYGAELMEHDAGHVRPGSLADLLVIDGDPLADIRVLKDTANILGILKGGAFEKNDMAGLASSPIERAVA